MNITNIGSGYVGLTTGACLAEIGNNVICVDKNNDKIENLKKGIVDFYEPGLSDIIKTNISLNTLKFSSSIEDSIKDSHFIFISVGTPQSENGSTDLSQVISVSKEIGRYLNTSTIIVIKSTVPVGTHKEVKKIINLELKKRGVIVDYSIVNNPEFLKEGSAVNDAMKPDRIVIGSEDEKAIKLLKRLYKPITLNHERFIVMNNASAEMTKYTANAMLATKISFMNEIANICENNGANINDVRIGIGSDSRIGYSFIYPGIGYGGSCFPKDIESLIYQANSLNVNSDILSAVSRRNQLQRYQFTNIIISELKKISAKKVAIWGLSFKPNTDDVREAPSVYIIKELLEVGFKIVAYDPKGANNFKKEVIHENLTFSDDKYNALHYANALVVLTEWGEFRDPSIKKLEEFLNNKLIFDGRNIYNRKELEKFGFKYINIGEKYE